MDEFLQENTMTKDELQGYLKQSGPVTHENQDANN